MSQSDPAQALRAYFRDHRNAAVDHPAPEELAAYRSEALDPERQAAIRAHLVDCEDCAELVLDLADLETSRGTSAEASEHEVERAWKKQRQRLFPERQFDVFRWGGWVAAAGLAIAVGWLALEVRDLRREQVAAYDRDLPRVIAKVRGVRSTEADLPVLELTRDETAVVLLLLQRDPTFTSYRAEILSSEGQSLWVRGGLSAGENLVLIRTPPNLLPAGVARIIVSGEVDDRVEPVGEYAFRARYR